MHKKNIAIICSWLDISKGIGSFFVEQAKLLQDEFDISLINFKPYEFGLSSKKKCTLGIYIKTEIVNNKIPVYHIHYPEIKIFNRYLFQSVIEIKAQKKIISKIKKPIDLCHAQSLFDAGFWCYKLHKNYKIPYIFTEHNQLNLKGLPRKKIKLLQKVIYNSTEKLVVSDDLIRQFASNDIFAEFHKIGNTFDEKCFNNLENLKSKSFKIITVGAYTPIKDYETMLTALKIVDEKIATEIKFTWIGCDCWGGDNNKIVTQLTKSLALKNIKVTIINSASKYEVATELKTSTVFISTSLCETFGVSVLEALACGIPVISTNSGGVLEMITPENGIICSIKTPQEIAENIIKLYNNEIVYDNEKISSTIKQKFGSTTFTEKQSSIYKQNCL